MRRLQRAGLFVERGVEALLSLVIWGAGILALVSIVVAAIYAAVHH